MLEASLREQRQPVSVEQARQARDVAAAVDPGRVRSLVADHGPRARQHLAYQALGDWTPTQREAIRTLAAATPRCAPRRSPDVGSSTPGFGESAEPQAAKASVAPAAPPGGSSVTPSAKPDVSGNGGTKPRSPQDQPPSGEAGG